MNIIDLTPEYEKTYFMCLEEWSDEMQEAGSHKSRWYEKMKDQGLRVKLAQLDDGRIAGMIQYLPIELSFVQGAGLYFVNCIWVHGHKSGVGKQQKHGLGKALLQAAEADARALGAHGLAAWGLLIPVFMKAFWFRKQGYRMADRQGLMALMWKPFTAEAEKPRWIKPRKKPQAEPGTVTVSSFINGWCPAASITSERARRAAEDLGVPVRFVEYDTSDRAVFLEWGISDALYVDDREISTGPPLTYRKIRTVIEKRLARLKPSKERD